MYIIKSYYFAEQYSRAISRINKVRNKINSKLNKSRLDLYLAKSYLYLGKDSSAFKIFSSLESDGLPEVKEHAGYGLAWSRIFNQDWYNADKYLNKFLGKYPDSKLKNEASLLKNDINKGVHFSSLSPTLAGVMSAVIPGSGQFYCKRGGDGVIALVLVSLLTYGTYYYYNNGPDGMFYGLAVLDIAFYLGNIYTAIASALKYNRNFNYQLKTEIITKYSY